MTHTLHARSGRFEDDADLRTALAKLSPPPDFVLLEPRIELGANGARGRIGGFCALTRGLPDLASAAVGELLLSWPDAALRVVVDGETRCWAALATDAAQIPLAPRGAELPALSELEDRLGTVCFRTDRDLARFQSARDRSGPARVEEGEIRIRSFEAAGRVVAWWLVEEPRGGWAHGS